MSNLLYLCEIRKFIYILALTGQLALNKKTTL